MTKSNEETLILAALQDLLIFQMAAAGVSQSQIRKALGLGMNRVNRIAKLVQKTKKADKE